MFTRKPRIQDELSRIFRRLDDMRFETEVNPAPKEGDGDPLRQWKIAATAGWFVSIVLALCLLLRPFESRSVEVPSRAPTSEPKVHVLPYTKLVPPPEILPEAEMPPTPIKAEWHPDVEEKVKVAPPVMVRKIPRNREIGSQVPRLPLFRGPNP